MPKKVQQAVADGNPENPGGLNPVVAAITQLEFQGNLIPHAWWRSEKLRFSDGQPNFTAMLILADICYWYRAMEKRDTSNRVVELRPKFGGDMLQKSYKEWAELFDLNKRQIRDAATFLVEHGLVKREFRNFESRGVTICNATFFEPIAAAIRELTMSYPDIGGGTSEGHTPYAGTYGVVRRNVIPLTPRRHTYTKNTHEITPKNTQTAEDMSGAAAPGVSAGSVKEIFAYWQHRAGHPNAKLTSERERKIRARLKDGYSVEDIKRAIDGWRLSPYHQGQNETGTIYDDIELICRSGAKLEGFIAKASTNGRGGKAKPKYCGKCHGGWLPADRSKGEERSRRCDCVKAES